MINGNILLYGRIQRSKEKLKQTKITETSRRGKREIYDRDVSLRMLFVTRLSKCYR